ncbi:MAG: GGDEF domain-containing protein [Patescibacteria group bacterium]
MQDREELSPLKNNPNEFPPGERPTHRLDTAHTFSLEERRAMEKAGTLVDFEEQLRTADQPYQEYKQSREQLQAENKKKLVNENETLKVERRKNTVSGIENQIAMEEDAETILKRCIELNAPVGLVMLDLDWFRDVNTKYGHSAGDEAIRETARRLVSNFLRSTDVLTDLNGQAYHLHGEEFAIMLPNTSADGIAGFAERMLEEMRNNPVEVTDKNGDIHKVEITVSTGGYLLEPTKLASMATDIEKERQKLVINYKKDEAVKRRQLRLAADQSHPDVDVIVQKQNVSREQALLSLMQSKADSALYKVKDNGRNSYMLFDDRNPFPPAPDSKIQNQL